MNCSNTYYNASWHKICRGKDIRVTFPVLIDGLSENLEAEDLLVELTDPHGVKTYPEFEVRDNVVSFMQYGRDQRLLGVYSCRLWLNKGKDGQCLLDIPHIFELVSTTDEENVPKQDGQTYNIEVKRIGTALSEDGVVIDIVDDLSGETKGEGRIEDGTLYITLYNIRGGGGGIVKVGEGLDMAPDGTISLYKEPRIESFSINPAIQEKGKAVTAVTLTFAFNKTMQSVQINGADATNGIVLNGNWTTDTAFVLIASDGKTTVTQAKTLYFGKKAYIGTNADILQATVANIKGLANSTVRTNKAYGNFTTSERAYIYYAVPKSWGEPTYTDGTFPYIFSKVGEAEITENGDTAMYALYRTVYPIPSSTTIKID